MYLQLADRAGFEPWSVSEAHALTTKSDYTTGTAAVCQPGDSDLRFLQPPPSLFYR